MQRSLSTPSFLLVALCSLSCLVSAGCGSDSPTSPSGSPDPDPVEETWTPVSARITSVTVADFGDKDGGDWDWTYGTAPERADVYVTLHTSSSSNAPFFVSDVQEDAYPGVRYMYTKASAGTGLPKSIPAGTLLVLRMMDDDGVSADDFMGQASVRPSSRHDGSHAESFTWYVSGSNETRFEVRGEWVY